MKSKYHKPEQIVKLLREAEPKLVPVLKSFQAPRILSVKFQLTLSGQ